MPHSTSGAVVSSGEGWAEVKRMFVAPAARGLKLGRQLLAQIETLASRNGEQLLRLEMGAEQPEALAQPQGKLDGTTA